MKTKVLQYLEVEKLVYPPEKLHVVVEEEKLNEFVEKELRFHRKKHGTTIDAGPDYAIEEGDIVMMKATSELPKFNRPMIPVSVGKGLFDQRIEEALLGLHLGESKELTIDGKPVTLEVLKVKTKTEAELNWEMVKDDVQKDYPNVDSLEAFENAKREEYIGVRKEDHYLFQVLPSLNEQILENLQVEIDEEEFQTFLDQINEDTAFYAESEGLAIRDLLRTAFPQWAEYSDEQIDEAYDEFNVNDFKMETYLQHVYYVDHPESQEEEYDKAMKDWAKETGETEEDCRTNMPYEEYMYRVSTGDTGVKMYEKYLEKVTVEVI